MLKVGDKAPDFDVMPDEGKQVRVKGRSLFLKSRPHFYLLPITLL